MQLRLPEAVYDSANRFGPCQVVTQALQFSKAKQRTQRGTAQVTLEQQHSLVSSQGRGQVGSDEALAFPGATACEHHFLYLPLLLHVPQAGTEHPELFGADTVVAQHSYYPAFEGKGRLQREKLCWRAIVQVHGLHNQVQRPKRLVADCGFSLLLHIKILKCS